MRYSVLLLTILLASCASAPKQESKTIESPVGPPAALSAQAPGLAPGQIDAALKASYDKYKGLSEGKNADYIPALAKVPSNLYGIALVTTDGQLHSIGDVGYPFSIQSISKV